MKTFETKAEWHKRVFGVRMPAKSHRRVSDWIGFNTGDVVTLKEDPRHTGRLEAIFGGVEAKIKWHDTGWISEEPLTEIAKVTL